MSFLVRFWGDFACFTRPEIKAERVSYDVITPSAARGALEAIYRHPGMQYIVKKIYVCKPVKTLSVRRNEVKTLLNTSKMVHAISAKSELPTCDTNADRTQRASLILQDVEYVVEADIKVDPNVTKHEKTYAIAMDRLTHGRWYHPPYFGCREFAANFELVDQPPTGLTETKDLGWMLWGMDFSNPKNPRPLFFHATMENGCISVPKRSDVI